MTNTTHPFLENIILDLAQEVIELRNTGLTLNESIRIALRIWMEEDGFMKSTIFSNYMTREDLEIGKGFAWNNDKETVSVKEIVYGFLYLEILRLLDKTSDEKFEMDEIVGTLQTLVHHEKNRDEDRNWDECVEIVVGRILDHPKKVKDVINAMTEGELKVLRHGNDLKDWRIVEKYLTTILSY